MLNTTELLKRKSSQVSTDTDTELSPSSVQLKKKMAYTKICFALSESFHRDPQHH